MFKVRYEDAAPRTRATIYANGRRAGELILTRTQAAALHRALQVDALATGDSYEFSGTNPYSLVKGRMNG